MSLTQPQWQTILDAEEKVTELYRKVKLLRDLMSKVKSAGDPSNEFTVDTTFAEIVAIYNPLYTSAKAVIQTGVDDLV